MRSEGIRAKTTELKVVRVKNEGRFGAARACRAGIDRAVPMRV